MVSAPARTRVGGLEWVDRLKGIAMLWVVLNHIVESLAGGNFAGDPTGAWPHLRERIAQWQTPVTGFGTLSWPLTGARDVGWLADQAVSIFIILSGFGLALGLIASHAGASIDGPAFFTRRLKRIYPFWWGAHVLFLPAGYLFASGLSTGDWQYYASFAGLRFIPGVFYYFASSWWYVGVIIQLYIAFPVLWWILRARGPIALLATTWGLGFLALAVGHAYFAGDLVEMWQRGIFAVTRFPEFGFGMALALWWARDPSRGMATLRRPSVRMAAFAAYVVGFACSFTLPGMIVAPTLLGVAALVLLYPLAAWRATGSGPLEFVGRHSFTIYLTHQYLIELFVGNSLSPSGTALAIVCALCATAVATFVLERGTATVETFWQRLIRRRGRAFTSAVFGCVALAIIALPVVTELSLRGTRAAVATTALRPDAAFGWRFLPSEKVALPGHADVWVLSNAEGFPGPAIDRSKSKDAARILVLGDAISSAQVAKAAAWPEILQSDLEGLHRPAEVANFAVNGYGPNQEAPIARSFSAMYRPDVVLVEVYPDDVEDVLTDTETLRKKMGLADLPDDPRSLLELQRVHTLLNATLVGPLRESLHRPPSGAAYSLGIVYLETGHDDWDGAAVGRSAERYREIARAATAVGARTILVFVPAPAQVCSPGDLVGFPRAVALADRSRYDLDLPNRRAREIAARAKLELWDLSSDLRATFPCPYVPTAPYLRPEAQRAIAGLLAPRLLSTLNNVP